MVFAAPLFLMSQTKAMRAFMVANAQGFTNVGFGLVVSYMALSLLGKMVRQQSGNFSRATAPRPAAELARRGSATPA